MKPEKKALLIGYLTCFGIATAITLLVFWSKGFFNHSIGENVQILADGFFVSGILMTMFAGFLYVASEGALIGISYVLRNVVLAFMPMGRLKHEKYSQYRERKLSGRTESNNSYVLIVGLIFLLIGIIFTGIWYTNFYNIV